MALKESVAPEALEREGRAGEEGGVEFGVALAALVHVVFSSPHHEALEGSVVGVEQPVVGDGGFGIPAALDGRVVEITLRM